jgi:general secretion pathway protein H
MRLAKRWEPGRGFTLIEMLVVLVIMGLFVGLVSVITRPDDRAQLRVEADRLAQLLDLDAVQSRLTGKPVAWIANGPGYRFWQFNEDTGWSEVSDSDLLHARTLPQGMLVAGLQVENMRPKDAMRLEFGPYGPAPAFSIEMAFGAERFIVAASPVGDIRVLPGAGKQNGNLALQ